MLNERKESILGIVAFISGMFLFIAIVGYAKTENNNSNPSEPVTPSTSISRSVTETPCAPVTLDSEVP